MDPHVLNPIFKCLNKAKKILGHGEIMGSWGRGKTKKVRDREAESLGDLAVPTPPPCLDGVWVFGRETQGGIQSGQVCVGPLRNSQNSSLLCWNGNQERTVPHYTL